MYRKAQMYSASLAVNVQVAWYYKVMSGYIWIAIKLQNWSHAQLMHHYDNVTLIWRCLKSCTTQLFAQQLFHGSWRIWLALYDVVHW